MDSSKKIISVITINLNDKKGLEETVQSVRSQNKALYEQIIIDGGSKDGSLQFIKDNAADFSYWVSEPDKGVYDAHNKGIRQAKGKYLLFLNAGDTVTDIFDHFAQFVENEEASVIYGCTYVQTRDGFEEKLIPPDKLSIDFWYRDTLNHQAVFFKRDLFERYGCYDTKYKFSADLDLLLKVFKKEPNSFKYFDAFVCNYSETGMSAKPENYKKIIEEKEQILATHLTAVEYARAKQSYLKKQSFKTRYRIFISERPALRKIVSIFKK